MRDRGFFISFEGGEGCGKSTQVKLLGKALEEEGASPLLTREPGGTPEGEKIRSLFARGDGDDWSPMADLLLLYASRTMHVDRIIKPALAQGRVVVTDRFTDSSRAYQAYARGLDQEVVERLNRLVIDGFEPDLTFILDIDVRTGVERAIKRLESSADSEDRFEKMDITFHEKIREGFLEIARRNPRRCIVIDANRSIEEITTEIQGIVRDRMRHV